MTEDAEVWRLAARAALAAGDPRLALERLGQALRLAPSHAAAWRDLGSLYSFAGEPAETAKAFRRALAIDMDDTHARLGLATALQESGDPAAAEREVRGLLARDPKAANGWFVLGDLLAAQARHRQAADAYTRCAELAPADLRAHYNLGLMLEECGDLPAALRASTLALEGDTLAPALAQLCYLKRQLCDWSDLDALSRRLREAVREGREGVSPFSFLSEPATPAEQRRCAASWAARKAADAEPLRGRLGQYGTPAPAAGDPQRLRVGLVSSGFNNHPTALLTVELIERLRGPDRHGAGLTMLGFATSADDGGALRRRIAGAFHEFHDIHDLGIAAMTVKLRAAGLDVVFDLRGYGGGAVTEVFALRVAPLQVNWLAYPGTSGASFIDYLLTDATLVPDALRAHCSEALLRLPHCFQPSDTTRDIGEAPSRTDCGLPQHGPVFASFNNAYKFAPEAFAQWMRILAATPDSVLWLLAGKHPDTQRNLRREAARTGVDPERLRFQEKLPHGDYLARYRHVDLFLDTWPYNAHTTASDALWAGCPVLTLPGETIASRVAASLLTALGLPELIAADAQDYAARAIALGTDALGTGALKARLIQARLTAPLFDMARYAQDFARAVRWMVERQRHGLPPTDYDLPVEPRRPEPA